MPSFNPDEQFGILKENISRAIEGLFPVESGNGKLVITNVQVKDEAKASDVTDQKKAVLNGKSWDVPIYGDVELQRNGETVDKKRLLLGRVPKLTDRYGFIVNGKEYQSYTQFRQRPGVYHRVAQNKKLVADYNLSNRDRVGGQRMRIIMDPSTAILKVNLGNSEIPIYHLLKSAGATDAEIKKAMGTKVALINEKAISQTSALRRLGKATGNVNAAKDPLLLKSLLQTSEIDPEVSQTTLGNSHASVDKDVLLTSVSRLVAMSKGKDEGDDKANLQFLSAHSVEDLIANRVRGAAGRVRYKARRGIQRKRTANSALSSVKGEIQRSINQFFTSSLASQDPQTNPLKMVEGHRKTTIMGDQGGVKSPFAVLEDSKLVNASHLSFLDPVHTPEGDKTGITLSLPLGVGKTGDKLNSPFIQSKTGKRVSLTPKEAFAKTVAFTDQYDLSGSKPKPRGKLVKATRQGKVVKVKAEDVDVIIPSPRSVLGVATNLVPFLQNNLPTRAMMAAKHQEQAVPLLYRETPKVQVSTDSKKTFEEIFGRLASFRSPIEGVVEEITKEKIVIRKGKKKETVQLYDDFPLEGGSLMNSEPTVKVGDKVSKDQVLADTNFTKGGTLALGINLRTAYMPFKGYNFEDGVVISESAAKKLTSTHITRKDTAISNKLTLGKRRFIHQFPHAFKKDQFGGMDDSGVVRVGAKVNPGDPLILVMSDPYAGGEKSRLSVIRKGKTKTYSDKSVSWTGETPGVVTDVVKTGDSIAVYVKTEEPAQQGDKLVGRHANKGIITRIVPDAQMPFTQDGDKKVVVDLLLNPMGIPGRINLGQILETAASKISDKKGEVYRVRNFEAGKDYLEDLKQELEEHDLTDKETLINPDTGRPYKQKVMIGDQYILKLRHQIKKKMKGRAAGLDEDYDISGMPTSGGMKGGVSLGELGTYTMLAHGARENLHEMFAYKSEQNLDFYRALRDGTPIPTPRVPFAFERFGKLLESMRVNIEKKGNSLALVPFTEEQVRQLAPKALKDPTKVFVGKTDKPAKGGLFDPVITGGYGGRRYARFDLAEPMPNPLFEDAIIKVTGLKKKSFQRVLEGKESINGKTGSAAIHDVLKSINVKEELKDTKARIKTARKGELSILHKKARYLQALDRNGLKPSVYMMSSVPVIPPVFRPLAFKPSGDVSNNDLNFLLRDVAKVNMEFKGAQDNGVPEEFLGGGRMALYDGLKALTGTGGSLTRQGEIKGILDIIAGVTRDASGAKIGGDSKRGFFQSKVMKRRQDFTGRTTITPEPRMSIDEVGLPEDIAYKLYKPFALRELARVYGGNKVKARKIYEAREPIVDQILKKVTENHPVIIKRDPSLHKFNIMAFKPRLVKGKSLEIHPLTVSGFNADFDGDAMNIYLPTTPKAIRESYGMFPSNNLFNPTTGRIQYTPGHEAILGVYLASKKGKKTNKSFPTIKEARSAYRKDEIEMTDTIKIGGKETSLGRSEINGMLPEKFKLGEEMPELGNKALKTLLTRIAKESPEVYGEVTNKLKDFGNDHSTELGFSIGLDDFTVVNKKRRDRIFNRALEGAKNKSISAKVEDFAAVDDLLDKLNFADLEANPTNIYEMVRSGSRASPAQLKQIISSPVLVKDGKDRVVPTLITQSYSEGMDLGSYWTTLHGARKGAIQKTQGVRDPGYISKQLINSSIEQVVTVNDCGTTDGIQLSIEDPDVADRYLAIDHKIGNQLVPRNTVFTSRIQAAAVKAGIKTIKVRSPMRCEADHGVCKHCSGLSAEGKPFDIGTNFGVIAAQAIGEPSTQLSLNVFHTGGLAKGKGSDSVNKFKQLSNLLRMPSTLQHVETAALAQLDGQVSNIKTAPQGGKHVFLRRGEKDHMHYVSAAQDVTVRKGQTIKKGDALSDGFVNPRDLLPLKGMEAVQDQISSDLYDVMKTVTPIRRRNIELVVKSATDSTIVDDPGDHPDWLRGDRRRISQVKAWNKKTKGKEVKHNPELFGIDVLPKMLQEDWIARLNYQDLSRSLAEAAQQGFRSNIHGFHPVPSLAFAKEFGKSDGVMGEY